MKFKKSTKYFGIHKDRIKKVINNRDRAAMNALRAYKGKSVISDFDDFFESYGTEEAYKNLAKYKRNRTPEEEKADNRIADKTINKYKGKLNIITNGDKNDFDPKTATLRLPDKEVINHEIEHFKEDDPYKKRLNMQEVKRYPGFYFMTNKEVGLRYPNDVIQREKRANRGMVMNAYLNDPEATHKDLERQNKIANISQKSYEERAGFFNGSPNLEWNTDKETVKKIKQNRGF